MSRKSKNIQGPAGLHLIKKKLLYVKKLGKQTGIYERVVRRKLLAELLYRYQESLTDLGSSRQNKKHSSTKRVSHIQSSKEIIVHSCGDALLFQGQGDLPLIIIGLIGFVD